MPIYRVTYQSLTGSKKRVRRDFSNEADARREYNLISSANQPRFFVIPTTKERLSKARIPKKNPFNPSRKSPRKSPRKSSRKKPKSKKDPYNLFG